MTCISGTFFFLNSRRWLIFFFVNLVGFYITKKKQENKIALTWKIFHSTLIDPLIKNIYESN